MKKKVGIMIMAMMVLFISNGFAQKALEKSDKRPEAKIEEKVDRMTKELGLSESQAMEVQGVLLDSQKQKKAVKAKYPELKEAKKELKMVKKYKKEQVNSILTKEQLTQKEEMKKSKVAHSENPKGQKKHGHPHKKKESSLNLTSDQKAEMKALNAKVKLKKEAISKKYPELKAAKEDSKKIKEKTKSDIKGILTAEQYEKYKELKKEHKPKKEHVTP